jgi:ribose transport system substrate-binding protein
MHGLCRVSRRRQRQVERIAGFRQAVEGKGIELVDVRGDDVDFAQAPAPTSTTCSQQILRSTAWSASTPTTHRRSTRRCRPPASSEAITVVAFDEDPVTLGAVREGSFAAGTVVQQPLPVGLSGHEADGAYLARRQVAAYRLMDKLIIVPTQL